MDWELVWIKAVSFSAGMSNVAWGRYQGNYLNLTQGVAANGAIRAAGLFGKFLTTPFWGALADEMSVQRLILFSVAVTSLLFDLYRWPSIKASFWPLLALKVSRSSFNGLSTLVDITTIRVTETKESGGGYGSQRLWGSIAWGVGSWAVGSIIDRFGYSAMFLWTYAWSGILFVLVLCHPATQRRDSQIGHSCEDKKYEKKTMEGWAQDKVNADSDSDESRSYVANNGRDTQGYELLSPIPGSEPPSRSHSRQLVFSSRKRKSKKSAIQQLGSLGRLLVASTPSSPLRPFLMIMLCYGTVIVLVETFMMVQLDRDYHSTKQFMGTLTLVGVLTQIPTFHYSSNLIQRFGHRRLLEVSHATLFLRLSAMSAFVDRSNYGPLLLLLQLSHGGCFALTWATAVDFSARTSPPGYTATCQGLTSTAYFVVGSGLGSVLWSSVYDASGGRADFTYAFGAACILLCGLVLVPALPSPSWNSSVLESPTQSPRSPQKSPSLV